MVLGNHTQSLGDRVPSRPVTTRLASMRIEGSQGPRRRQRVLVTVHKIVVRDRRLTLLSARRVERNGKQKERAPILDERHLVSRRSACRRSFGTTSTGTYCCSKWCSLNNVFFCFRPSGYSVSILRHLWAGRAITCDALERVICFYSGHCACGERNELQSA